MFRVKICGIKRADDARQCVAAGADAIGLNFYPASPRYVELDAAAAIVATLPAGVARVGVFVNANAETIRECHRRLGLNYVQLHGDESPELAAQLPGIALIRAVRCHAGQVGQICDWVARCRAMTPLLAALLVDAVHAGQYGGTGRTADWTVLARLRDQRIDLPLILAGGLTPENVAAAIDAARPDGVDTASGVERAPGEKDADKVGRFVAAAREALRLAESGKQATPASGGHEAPD